MHARTRTHTSTEESQATWKRHGSASILRSSSAQRDQGATLNADTLKRAQLFTLNLLHLPGALEILQPSRLPLAWRSIPPHSQMRVCIY